MRFVRTPEYLINPAYIVAIYESADGKSVCISLHENDRDYITMNRLAWNKACVEAGVPGLQFF